MSPMKGYQDDQGTEALLLGGETESVGTVKLEMVRLLTYLTLAYFKFIPYVLYHSEN